MNALGAFVHRLAGLALTLLAAALAGSCTGRFTSPPELGERAGVQPLCAEIAEVLRIEPVSVRAGAGQLVLLGGRGGTGAHRWELVENASGGSIDAATGVYVAGASNVEMDSTIDVVRLRDRACRGEAVATIAVVDAPSITPQRASVRPSTRLELVGRGGSGRYTFTLVAAGSGGSVSPDGRYEAGVRAGTDVVRLRDLELGGTADARVEVSADAGLVLVPSEWVIPVGSSAPLPVRGGSSEYDVSVEGEGVEREAGTTLRAVRSGQATVTFRDRFTGEAVVASVRAEEAQQVERRHPGDRMETHLVVSGAHDLDGDGLLDAVVGMPDASGEWFESGVVRVYRGRAGGLDPTPVREISGRSRDEELGRAVVLADLDGDGLLDLIVGARRADPIRRDSGAVYVYPGVRGGFFAPEPERSWTGQAAGELFGHSVAACDFDGDGHLDVAVGSPSGQRPGGARAQGVVRVFLQRPESSLRFASAPDVTLAGAAFGDEGWQPVADLRLGESMAAGDFDGDGACDLAVYQAGPTPTQRSSGAVVLHRGRRRSGMVPGGLELEPAVVWGRADGTADSGRFGLGLAMGDVDGDGRVELLAARPRFAGPGTDAGALYVLRGRPVDGAATAITDFTADAWWSFEGGSGDRVGSSVALLDVDGDRNADVVSGDGRAALPMSMLVRPGVVRVFPGGSGGIASTPTREIEGLARDDRFGFGVGAIGDLDGDGRAELLAFSPHHDTVQDGASSNDDRGALHLLSSRALEPVELSMTRPPSGQRVGQSLAWIGDLDGDGFPELAVGASQADPLGLGFNAGSVRIHRGTAQGVTPAPVQTLERFAGHGEGDELGWTLASAGDFDGDGVPDLAVLARSEDLPAALDPAVYEAGSGCARRDNPGAVLVFRGRADARVAPEPSFVFFGPEANQRIEALVGGLDVNGDGLSDLVIGGREWDAAGDNRGGVAVIYGRAALADRIVALCEPDTIAYGSANGVRLGTSVAALGDLDRDGCDEYAAGAPFAAPGGVRAAGEVQVFFPACGGMPERVVQLRGRDVDSEGGAVLGGGVDLDGDGTPDLVVGLPRFRDGRGEVGRAILVRGAGLADRDGMTFAEAGGVGAIVDGTSAGERLGSAIAVARRGTAGVVVLGGPFGAAAGRVDGGGALIYEVGGTGFAVAPRLWVSGESGGEGQLGASAAALALGGRLFVAVGAPWSTRRGALGGSWVDDGASYAFALDR